MKKTDERAKRARGMIILLTLSLVFWVQGLFGAVENSEKVPHRVPKIDTKIRVDGNLDEEAWQKALKLELKYEVSPGENIEPPARTEVFIFYSNTHFYAGFIAYDPDPSAIRARLTDRDKIWWDDWVAITLDTFNDHRRRFSFFCNPHGIQTDIIETISNQSIPWDGIWASAGRIVETGYRVEIAIPFNTLRFQRTKEDQVWTFDVCRSYPRSVRHVMGLVKFDRSNTCYMCQAEKMIGFKGIKPGKNIELDPTLSVLLTQERENFTEGKFIKKESKVDPGLTARWSFTPNMTLSAAINPDFSTVEADVAQLDINTQFALYYKERRPFFLEGASLFATRLPVVYTRSLADPNWGIKLTGKEGGHAIGFYSVQDSMTNLFIPQSTRTLATSLDMKSVGTVLRYQRDIGNTSALGLVVTDREGSDYYNRVVGIDADIRLSKSDQVQVQLLASQTRYPQEVVDGYNQSEGKIKGTGLEVYYNHNSRNIGFYSIFRQVTPGFRADLGFITQAGYRHMAGGFDYSWLHNPGHWYTLIKIGPAFEYETDHLDNLIYKTLKFTLNYNGPAQSDLVLEGSLGKRFYMGKIFDINQVSAQLVINPSGELLFGFYGIYGDHIDFDNSQAGTRILLNPGITYKAGRHLSIDLDHVFERMDVEAGRLYTANVSNLRLVYQFSKRAFLRTILQYVHYDYNTDNYTFPIDPRFKHFFSQILFSYKINPQTMLFLGYSDDHYGYLHVPLTQTNRTFFLKIGYALVL